MVNGFTDYQESQNPENVIDPEILDSNVLMGEEVFKVVERQLIVRYIMIGLDQMTIVQMMKMVMIMETLIIQMIKFLSIHLIMQNLSFHIMLYKSKNRT